MDGIKAAVVALVVLGVTLLSQSPAQAEDIKFKYKFPCRPWSETDPECQLNQGPHGGAIDFKLLSPPGEFPRVQAVSEAIFVRYDTESSVCTGISNPNDPDLGKFAVLVDMFGRTLTYAHLSAFGSLTAGQRVLQGDFIGLQGDTGRTEDCADHLHLGGIVGIDFMDGVASSQLVTVHPHRTFSSTNSPVGVPDTPGAAIRTKYFDLGSVFTSWAVVGWTGDHSGFNNGCSGSMPVCRLHVHYWPNVVSGHWGSRQEFRAHPDSSGFGWRAIMAGRWAVSNAYVVQQSFYEAWYAGGEVPSTTTRYNIGIPIMDRIGNHPTFCQAAFGCLEYQRFHLGYVRNKVSDGIRSFFCPDVWPAYPNQDGHTDAFDMAQVVIRFGVVDPAAPNQPWFDAWYDMDGNGIIDGFDIARVVQGFGVVCYPTS